ncbi:iron-containing alcohol dehydrogenase [Pigmentiphaga aceris]|uniref:Iron-containing alcohol dehydrogenase n=1 Tax=Pigmentiphaga aceris TaxID=1940612 RepID=A0A5C0AW66_9BURK|nr:iron-containing alcohol dehydrogenase [Pigmentiphaga aceris]QEI06475.1 iron-containing alcohol dehydrogenase [Pigmentiphaga aceris]
MITINYLTSIEFGSGAVQRLPQVLEELGIKRPMLVTDAGIARAGILTRICAYLSAEQSAAVFTDTPPNPTEEAVELATEFYRKHACDGLIAIGGGSPIDLAKGVALMATHDGPLSRYAGMAAMPLIGPQAVPMIAVPTTAGTGSEVGRGALICLRDGRKLVFVSQHLLPKRALCDPDLTLGMPAALTAGTGMDAFTHCVETFLSPRVNPPAEAIALDGAARAWRWLERAVTHPNDAQARWEMMMAGIHGGLAFQKGLGAVHALAHPLGALIEPMLHHGTVNAVLLPVVLRFNAGHVGDKYARLKQAFGLPADADLAAEVAALNTRIGMPSTLRELGVSANVVDRIVAGAMADHSTPTNPRPLTERDAAALFMEALGD